MTYEMVGVADHNNRTYESKYGTYNKEGFRFNDEFRDLPAEKIANILLHENCWSLKVEKPKPKKMTKADIEKALGYEIEIEIGSEDVKPTNTKCKHRLYDTDLERMAYETDELIRQCFLRR